MVYILIYVTGVLMAGLIFAGCSLSDRVKNPTELTGLSLTQNHMNFGYCYSFYLRKENGKVLFDAEVGIEKEPYRIILEDCYVDHSYLAELLKVEKEYSISGFVKNYKSKPSLFSADDATVNKTTVYFSDGKSKTARSKDEHIKALYDFFFNLAEVYADKSVYKE